MITTLTGGPLGGTEISDPSWNIGETRTFDGAIYRKDADYAVFVGTE